MALEVVVVFFLQLFFWQNPIAADKAVQSGIFLNLNTKEHMETSSEADKIRRDKILAVSQSYRAQRGECTDTEGLKKN